jgi:hypothetical protein
MINHTAVGPMCAITMLKGKIITAAAIMESRRRFMTAPPFTPKQQISFGPAWAAPQDAV